MQFASLEFAVFFLIVFTLHWTIGPRALPRKVLLIGASFFFYGILGTLPLSLLLFSCFINYIVGNGIVSAKPMNKKTWFWVGIGFNLGYLGLYKYLGFFRDSITSLVDFIGFEAHLPIIKVLLPIGISFYTFQALTYLIDLYKGNGIRAKSLMDFTLFQCFFPQLLIGPICRSVDLLPQIQGPQKSNIPDMAEACRLILSGLFKKTVIATLLFEHGAHEAFQNPEAYSMIGLWAAMIGYSIQLYCDFSGYTDMARGFALLLGYRLPENFRRPYGVTNLGEFWKKWHITFSQWLRDYIYIPLGGSFKSPWRISLNLFLTFLFCGLWHGASWGYIIWGAIHGIGLAAHKRNRDRKRLKGIDPNAPLTIPWAIIGWTYTFLFVSLSRVVFQSPTIEVSMVFYQKLYTPESQGIGAELTLLIAISIGLIMNFWGKSIEKKSQQFLDSLPKWILMFGTISALTLILLSRPGGVAPYLYFRF